ncbi:MAG: hypothetical protein FWC97_03855 [Treponema sp.]|nr:hypothetical protein [Treponema sp.]
MCNAPPCTQESRIQPLAGRFAKSTGGDIGVECNIATPKRLADTATAVKEPTGIFANPSADDSLRRQRFASPTTAQSAPKSSSTPFVGSYPIQPAQTLD